MTDYQSNLFGPEIMSGNEILYKYRSLQNWKFLLDIFINKRFYAAKYKELNDPMEGFYNYRDNLVSREFRKTLRNEKGLWKICSITRNYRNTLMWSYYADGHHGVAIGVKVREISHGPFIVRDVDYPPEVHLDSVHTQQSPDQVALHILSQKQSAWQHEDEVRIFTHAQFVDIEIHNVYLGCHTDQADCELIRKLVEMTAPDAKIVRLERTDLDKPINLFRTKRKTVDHFS